MPRDASDPLLLTPGPVSVSRSTKEVMLKDRASGGTEFVRDLTLARNYMVALVNGQGAYTAIPLPGSATYANEAVIAGLVPPGGKLLVHTNGVYGDRLIEICAHTGVPHAVIRTAPFSPTIAEPVIAVDERHRLRPRARRRRLLLHPECADRDEECNRGPSRRRPIGGGVDCHVGQRHRRRSHPHAHGHGDLGAVGNGPRDEQLEQRDRSARERHRRPDRRARGRDATHCHGGRRTTTTTTAAATKRPLCHQRRGGTDQHLVIAPRHRLAGSECCASVRPGHLLHGDGLLVDEA